MLTIALLEGSVWQDARIFGEFLILGIIRIMVTANHNRTKVGVDAAIKVAYYLVLIGGGSRQSAGS